MMVWMRVSSRASMCAVSVVTRQPPRGITGSSTIVQARSRGGRRELLAHDGRIFRMQMNAHIARRRRQQRHGFANDRDHLRRIHPQLTTHELPRDRDRELHELLFDLRVELLERLRNGGEHLVDASRPAS